MERIGCKTLYIEKFSKKNKTMKNKILIVLFCAISWASCSNNEAVAELQTKLEAAQAEIETLRITPTEKDETGDLVHVVYFKVKPDATAQLLKEIEKLESIDVLHGLEVGSFKDLGDKRALADYQVVMKMTFDNEADYKTYQAHPLHLKLKENAKALLAGPPATYDYILK